MNPEPTTVTRLTSPAPAAIAVIEVRGARALDLVQLHWTPHQGSSELLNHRIRYGVFRSKPHDATSIGESIVAVRRGADVVELHCHGGQLAALRIVNALVDSGAEELSRHGWIERQIHGLTAAQATEDLLRATTLRTARILMDQARGVLDRELQVVDRYEAEGNMDKARGAAEAILRWADVGAHLIHPWRVVLCGPPNVGKSSLLNRLLGYDRAVVHDRAGTTRDLLAESTSIEGWPVILIDSAGIRRSDHEVEGQGIERARRAIASADRLLLLIDPLEGWTMEHESIWCKSSHRCLLIQTKADIQSLSAQRLSVPSVPLRVSAVSGEGVEGLMRAIAESLVAQLPPPGAAVPFRSEHIERLISIRARTGG